MQTDHAQVSQWLRAQLIGAPLAMLETHLDALEASGFEVPAAQGFEASRFAGEYTWQNRYTVTENGTCIIPVHGVLVDRGAWLGNSYWGGTAYEGLAEQFRRAGEDDEIKHVLLDLNSPGGTVAGLYDLVEVLKNVKERKPVTALANSMACSAAYAIGCVADSLFVNRTGTLGSIGIIAKFADYSAMDQRLGIKRTTIRYGALKQAGSSDEPMSVEARAMFQAECDRQGEAFVAHVAEHRGLDPEAVRGTDARCYIGSDGVAIGLADGVLSFEECLARIKQEAARPRAQQSHRGTTRMSQTGQTQGQGNTARMTLDDETIGRIVQGLKAETGSQSAAAQQPAAAPPSPAVVTEDQLRAAVADAGRAGGAAAVDRIKAIFASEHAQGHMDMARKLAFERTELAADAAIDLLATMAANSKSDQSDGSFADGLQSAMKHKGNSAGVAPDAAASAAGGTSASAHGDFFKTRIEKKFGGKKKSIFG